MSSKTSSRIARNPGAGIAFDGFLGDGLQRPLFELEIHLIHLEQFLVLATGGIARLDQDLDQGILVKGIQVKSRLRPTGIRESDRPKRSRSCRKNLAQNITDIAAVPASCPQSAPKPIPSCRSGSI